MWSSEQFLTFTYGETTPLREKTWTATGSDIRNKQIDLSVTPVDYPQAAL